MKQGGSHHINHSVSNLRDDFHGVPAAPAGLYSHLTSRDSSCLSLAEIPRSLALASQGCMRNAVSRRIH
jgi:hypothetical protein